MEEFPVASSEDEESEDEDASDKDKDEDEEDFVLSKQFKGAKSKSKEPQTSSNTLQSKTLIVDFLEQAESIIKDHELKYTVKYSIYSLRKGFGNTDIFIGKHKIYWEDDDMEYSGTPFIVANRKLLDCHHGKDRNTRAKIKLKEKSAQEKSADHNYRKHKVIVQDTKKFNCPASVKIKEVIVFPEHKLNENKKRKKDEASKLIRTQIKDKNVNLKFERKFLVVLPNVKDHKFHFVEEGAGISQSIDAVLSKKISSFVSEGVLTVKEMKRHLKIVVKNEIFRGKRLPPRSNRRFWPETKTIQNHIDASKCKLRRSMIDQENLLDKIKDWKIQNDQPSIYFRPKCTENQEEQETNNATDEVEPFLFVYQEEWQKRLLSRYGNEIAFIDATYRTTRYALPLFFLVVKTNVNYQVVATFVLERENEVSITEALSIIKDWNPAFQPKYFMTDYCNEEINSIKTVFGSTVFLCDFHREQAWERWFNTKSNECVDIKQQVLGRLRSIARSTTIDEMESNFALLNKSEWWNDASKVKLQDYLNKYWFKIKEMWVWAFRQERLLVNCNTNNGTERQNESFKYSFLEKRKSHSLTGMLTILIEEFLPSNYERYCDENLKCNSWYRAYASNVPEYLRNKPRDLVKHCMLKIEEAKHYDKTGITVVGEKRFKMLSFESESRQRKVYSIFFGDENTMPSCSCESWRRSAYPCKHIFAIFAKYAEYSWESLSPLYITSPFLCLDQLDNDVQSENTTNNSTDVEEDSISSSNSEAPLINDLPETSNINSQNDPVNDPVKIYSTDMCLERLKRIRELIYNIQDQPVVTIKQIYEDMVKLEQKLEKISPKEAGLPLRSKKQPRETWLKRKTKMQNIPIYKKPRTEKIKKRVGEKKEKVQAAANIVILDTTIKPKNSKKREEEVTEEIVFDDLANIVISSDEECDDQVAPTERFVETSLRSLLNTGDLLSISNQQMLSDNVINVLQKMLKRQYHNTSGLQDTVLGQTLSFDVIQNKPFVQILHNGNAHWLAISTFHCEPGHVNILDSKCNKGRMTVDTKKQIAAIMFCQTSSIIANFIPVQQQTNGIDCGLYAIAFVQHILSTNQNPSKIHYDQSKMRPHLLKSLMANKLLPFPQMDGKCKQNPFKTMKIPLLCSCRQYWVQSDERISIMKSAQCSKCKKWFHQTCENIPDVAYKDENSAWFCAKCS